MLVEREHPPRLLWVQLVRYQFFHGVCPDLLFRYLGIQVTQALDLSSGGFNLVHHEDGRDGDWGRDLSAYFVHCLQITPPRPFLVSPKDADIIPDGELHGQVTDGWSTTMNSTIRVTLSVSSPIVNGRLMVPADVDALPGEPVQRWSSQSASSSVKVIGVLSWAYLGNMFCHIDIFSASEPPSLTSVTSPATSSVSSNRSTKDGVDYMFLLRLYSRTGIEIRPGALDHGLPLLWSALVGLVSIRLPFGKPGLFLGYQPSPSDVLVRFGMPLGDPP
ncbi:hypothetical protein TIFTF001_046932 [Ficus carica]|uniref:Uncharacterized protein n=1 Tax=Ficus carica TaxID=3494 RepID=A0AA87YWD5_FICCA|nr:hypothetical protein TIFTF001_046932 [Ficus carica]